MYARSVLRFALAFVAAEVVWSANVCTNRPQLPPNTHEYFPGSLQAPVKNPPYPHGHTMYFECNQNDGYISPAGRVWWMNSLKCNDGQWTKGYLEKSGAICEKAQCKSNERTCGSRQCIPSSKWCDCVHDCQDGSDEANCKPIKMDVSQLGNSGQLRRLFFDNGFPSKMDCTLNITTTPGKRFKFEFSTFDLRPASGMSCNDYITFNNVDYGDQQVLCYSALCPWCQSAPTGLKSKTNWVGVHLVTTGPTSDHKGLVIDWKSVKKPGKGGSTAAALAIVGGILVVSGGIVAGVIFAVVRCRRRHAVPHTQFVNT